MKIILVGLIVFDVQYLEAYVTVHVTVHSTVNVQYMYSTEHVTGHVYVICQFATDRNKRTVPLIENWI